LEYLDAKDLQVAIASDSAAALKMLREQRFDCMVLSQEAADLADQLIAAGIPAEAVPGRLPVIVYGDGELVHDHEAIWKRLEDRCTVRRVHSPDRLLDLATFFLHRAVANLPDSKRQLLQDLHQSDKLLASKKVLVVDDDMRNIFALSSVLEEHDMVVLSADNGRDAINLLQKDPNVDIVLMDIMMPEMDGMETMREIRKIPELKNLPIVAVTAKAMKGDREKCIEAGAWDYLAKPVDTEQMLAVLRAWLHR
jgi:CheY-like chemotaxis protein